MRHHLFGPVIGEGHGTAARVHHLFRARHDRGERIDRDVHRHGEIVAAGVDIPPAQLVLVRKAYGVDQKIKAAPAFFQVCKEGIHRRLVAHVAGQNDVAIELSRQWVHTPFQRIALI